jgi:hypothetical protein
MGREGPTRTLYVCNVEFLIQLMVEVVFQFVFEGIDGAVRSASRTRVGRFVLFVLFSLLPALGLGYLWGWHVKDIGQTAQPWSMWISLAVAAVLLGVAFKRRNAVPLGQFTRLPKVLHLSSMRMVMLALANITAAAGMAWGFNS